MGTIQVDFPHALHHNITLSVIDMSPSNVHRIEETDVVNEVIAAIPRTVGVFNERGIDACCGGAVSIREAAERDGADLSALMHALHQIADESDESAAARPERSS